MHNTSVESDVSSYSGEHLVKQASMVSGESEDLTILIEESKDENPLDKAENVSQVYAEMGKEQARIIKQDKENLLKEFATAVCVEHIESKRTDDSDVLLPVDTTPLDGA